MDERLITTLVKKIQEDDYEYLCLFIDKETRGSIISKSGNKNALYQRMLKYILDDCIDQANFEVGEGMVLFHDLINKTLRGHNE